MTTIPTQQHHFRHDAMATTFDLCIENESPSLAKSIVRECIDEIDRLETILSRYAEGSDVQQINHMKEGSSLLLSDECYACLRLAMEAYVITDGLFDITLGKRAEQRKRGQKEDQVEGALILHPDKAEIHCQREGRELDLGGIGKGYTLDWLAKILRDRDIKRAIITSGGSTILTINDDSDDKAWPVKLYGESESFTIDLHNCALSASGTAFQGSHIIAPDGRNNTYAFKNIWITGLPAAYCDAFSTACFLMTGEELEAFARQTPEVTSIFVEEISDKHSNIRKID